jgi:hypothetical protein
MSERQEDWNFYYTVEETRRFVGDIQKGTLITIVLYLLVSVAVSLLFLGGRGLWGMVIFAFLAGLGVWSVCARTRANDAAVLLKIKDMPGLSETEQKKESKG